MARGKIDRRVERTRTALQDAFRSLLAERDYEAITVEEICASAHVGRTTFYAHYASKNDLKRGSIDDRLRTPLMSIRRHLEVSGAAEEASPFGFSLAVLRHAREHVRDYDALAGGKGRTVALGTVQKIVSDLVREEFATGRTETPQGVRRDFAVQFVTGAFMALLAWWLDGGAAQSPEQVDAAFRELSTQGFRASAVNGLT